MSGRVVAGSPWMRDALRQTDPDELARIEAAIPDGSHVALLCGSRPRPLGAVLVRGVNDQVARVEPAYSSVSGASDAVLRLASEAVA